MIDQNELAVQTDRIIEQYRITDTAEGLDKQQALRAIRYRTMFILTVEASNFSDYEKKVQIFIATKKMTLRHFWSHTKNERELRAKEFDIAYAGMRQEDKENEDGSICIRFRDTGLFANTIRNFHVITPYCAPRKTHTPLGTVNDE